MRLLTPRTRIRELCIAQFNQILIDIGEPLHKNKVDYKQGWFYVNGKAFRRPDLIIKARELLGKVEVDWCTIYNTYRLPRN